MTDAPVGKRRNDESLDTAEELVLILKVDVPGVKVKDGVITNHGVEDVALMHVDVDGDERL